MFNCGILAIELDDKDINSLFALHGSGKVTVNIELDNDLVIAENASGDRIECTFTMNPFDKELVGAGGWLAYADQKY
jgi:3-isopropylmalate/(R)-2-methylmalate dehydratase small subunit